MPETDAFLRAILDNPDDDAPRLIYADWLEEHGDPEQAEFIRVQIALAARKPARGREANRNLVALLRREEELLTRHGEAWRGPVETGRNLSLTFRRGFIEGVSAEAHRFVEVAEQLFRRAPVRHVRLFWPGTEQPYERARFVATVAAAPQLARLRSLDLSTCFIGSDGVRALAVCEYLGGLESLDLANNGIGRAGARALAGAPWLGKLTFLDLSRNDIDPSAVRALATGLDVLEQTGALRLQELYLFENPLRQAGRRVVQASAVLRRVARL